MIESTSREEGLEEDLGGDELKGTITDGDAQLAMHIYHLILKEVVVYHHTP